MQTAVKAKSCSVCERDFVPFNSMQIVCGRVCARKVPIIARKQEKAEKRRVKARIDALRPLSYWAKAAEHEVNRYVRLRDVPLPCVSCPRPASWDGQWHASHFRSVGAAPELRFHLWNIHKACSVCNNWKSGNLSEYEPSLRARIGDAKVDWLRSYHEPVKATREYLMRLRDVFRTKSKRIEARASQQ